MIDIDKFPKTYEKSKSAYEEKHPYDMINSENTHNSCLSYIYVTELLENSICTTKCVDMMYKILCHVFTEAERSWLFTKFIIREKREWKSYLTYSQMISDDAYTLEDILEESRTNAWHNAEKKRLQDEEIQLIQRIGIDCEKFQKKVTWFLILLDKLTAIDRGSVESDSWLEDWDDGITAFHEFDPDDFIK